jgi:hypothetical protein
MRRALFIVPLLSLPLLLPLSGCSEAIGDEPPSDAGTTSSGGEQGAPLAVPVPDEGRVFVKLAPPAIVTPAGDGATSTDWDLAFEGLDVYTNSGPSGPGNGGAFGPLDSFVFLADQVPEVPFIQRDASGGAFLGWNLYDNSAHALWSRYHVYGVRDGEKLWKVQILGYYGQLEGAPVSALYKLRYAEVSAGGVGATQTLMDIDGTAGGLSAPGTAPSDCLDFGAGKLVPLTPEEARQSSAWHLCFVRDKISVNGGLSGPRGVTAVDLDAGATASETLEQVEAKTALSEQPRFDAMTYDKLTDPKLAYHGDRIVSAFSDSWIDPAKSPRAPALATWLVVAADGAGNHLLAFDGFTSPTDRSPGTVRLRIKAVSQ